MAFYRYHVFFCTNQRPNGQACCGAHDAGALRDYLKQRVKALKLKEIRINTAGCLNRCGQGPLLVVYPEAVWYTYATPEDVDEILNEHLCHGRVVTRLQVPV